MNINNTVTMVVGLVVGVLLIAGVVTPVIANVSDDSGSGSGEMYTNTGTEKFTYATNSTSISYYCSDEFDKYYIEPETVTDRTLFDGPIYVISEQYGAIFIVNEQLVGQSTMVLDFSINTPSVLTGYTATQIDISGKTMTLTDLDSNQTVTISDIIGYSDPNGSSVSVTNQPYAFENTPILCDIVVYESPATTFVTIYGTVSNPTVVAYTQTMDSYTYEYETESVSNATATITLTENQITAIEFSLDGTSYTTEDAGVQTEFVVLPIEVREGSGGGISGTLATILSVIPLVLTVGLVIGAISYLRFKE